MGQDMRNDSRVCRTPPGPPRDLILHWKPNPILVAVSLTLILMTSGLVYYRMLPLPEPPRDTGIVIDGDADFSAIAQLEGWPGDGSPENPYIVDGLEITLDGGWFCISISNTRVNFIIRNCNLTGASYHNLASHGAGISLHNVANGELVNNICSSNWVGIHLRDSDYNTVTNNTCNGNNRMGICLGNSHNNNVTENTCTSNRWGIYLYGSDSNTLANNTCLGNTEQDIFGESGTEEPITEEPVFDELARQEYVAKQFVWFIVGSGMILVVSVIAFVKFRRIEI